MELFIRNMVCDRCVKVVERSLRDLAIHFDSVSLGEVHTRGELSATQLSALKSKLEPLGFELLDNRKASLVNKVKGIVIRYVHGNDAALANRKLSVLIAEKTGVDYNSLSALFSAVEGLTIEKYAIAQRIERVKELLTNDEMNLNEIATKLSYSSVQHLSQQFKKFTGITPSEYRQLKESGRKPLDEVGRNK